MQRLQQLASHFASSNTSIRQSSDDVVITMAIRSPLCKAKKGGLKDTRTDELMLEIFKHAITRSGLRPELVGDICVGTVLTPDAGYHARSAALAAGFPESVPVQIINRFCSSGLMAITTVGNQIRSGQIEIGLAVGVESMSDNPDRGGPVQSELIASEETCRDCCKPMGWTSENVAQDFNVTREEQDEYAAVSFQRAEKAQDLGYFDEEIVPFTVFQIDAHTGERKLVKIHKDDGIRAGTKETLAKVRSAFPQWGNGTTTGGNASQVTDGAAAVLLMTRRKANELGLPILGRHLSTAVVGVPPRIMGVGPVYAISQVLRLVGMNIDDVDLFEINEAFASQCVYTIKALELPIEKVNVNGGAIAIGHPLGCTGTRQVVTGLAELRRRKGKILVTSMCIGTGMGAAGVFVSET